ncbi:MAG TPA: hypothetical protein VM198_09980 [Longimicrobiales bacterium]|nr:hypothetical protein [Longimicrobiales bacterium]
MRRRQPMLTLFWILFWALLAALTVAAGWSLYERRMRRTRERLVLDDDAIRTILDTGELHVDEDEPLNLEAIDEEEERFWSETWDEPDDWGSPR